MLCERIGRKKFNLYAMDVESHNDEESIAKRETSIWLGCLINDESKIDDESSYFYDIEDFINRLDILSQKKRNKAKTRICSNIAVYIYNLSFEWSFILPVLISKGWKWSAILNDESEKEFNSVSTRSVSSVWEVNLHFGKKNGVVKLRDLSKIYGGGLGKVAKSFGLETQKGEIDYRLNRLHNHIVTQEEKEYCFKDTRIIIEILMIMSNRKDKDFFNSISMASYSMRQLVKFGYPRITKPYKAFREDYPELSQEENEFLRKGVEGGITYAPREWQFKDIKTTIYHVDALSSSNAPVKRLFELLSLW